ncbi:uracil-DNA glycosylase [Ornithinimicrobium sp. W1679]|uniref:uracil-DNA glycosylase n=1 Tax=Ornithinimicrobium sp. W1679 TaxID=3418770 RepID=UPI003CEB8B28
MLSDWDSLRRQESVKDYWAPLQQFVAEERAQANVFPSEADVFAAFALTPLDQVKAVILGQDPYPTPGYAHGIAFSVPPCVNVPRSLHNIFTELEDDLGAPRPDHGCLDHWASQGVLLLNTALTVRERAAGSHLRKGWQKFTDEAIRTVAAKEQPVIFILWGNNARRKKRFVAGHHSLIESSHPSDLSARKGFFGSRPFSRANEHLASTGREAIDWQIPSLSR